MADVTAVSTLRPAAAAVPAIRHFTIWPGNAIGDKWKTLARALQARTGATCSLICSMPEDTRLFERTWHDLTSSVRSVTQLYAVADEPVASTAAVEGDARDYERRFGCRMVDLLQSDRHLGRAYSSGGVLYPRSRLGSTATYHQSLRVAMAMLDFFDRYLDEQQTDLMFMEGVGSLHTLCLAVALRKRGIPLRCPAPSRFRNYAYWGENEFFESAAVERTYQATAVPSEGRVSDITGPYLASSVERRRQLGRMSLRGALYGSAKDVARFAYQRVIRYRPYAGNWLSDTIAYRLRTFTRHRHLERIAFTDAAALDGVRYVFYPLNHEPEASLSVAAPEFNHQAGLIDLLAKSLPAGVSLVVKEHQTAGIAARPPGFYDWLAALPNVRLASMHLNAVPLIRRSRAVAILTGTAGMEAAVLGVPVLSFGRHNPYNSIPHVQVVDSFGSLRPLLDELCDDATHAPPAVAARQREGARFLEALLASSVDLGDEQMFSPAGALSERNAERLIDLLFSTL